MDSVPHAIQCLARLVMYPGRTLQEDIEECEVAVSAMDSALGAGIRKFRDRTAGMSLGQLEEIYIQTFDMNPTCTLDLGWQLFGEDYNRGLFLVKVRQEMKRLGIAESHELPDHLTNVLLVLSRMERDQAEDFACSCVLPALDKTRNAVNESCPYRQLMDAVVHLLSIQYGESRKETTDGALV
jgi:nitrate reductase delta subunit